MEHEILYKRAKTGKPLYWKVWVQEADSEMNPRSIIHKEAGEIGTLNPKRHKEEITKGKNIGKSNETSAYEQAVSDAVSDWKKKRDDGYKTLADLGITDHGDYVSKDGQDLSLVEMLDTVLSEFNTDASGNVKPMLANTVKWNKVKYPVYVQPKLDGVRCLMVFYSESNDGSPSAFNTTMLSRKGKEFTTLNHIKIDVGHARMNGTITKSFILDGEIYSDELSFQEISQAVKKQYPNSLKLKFRAYDIVTDSLQHTRLTETEQLVTSLTSEHITMVQTHNVHSREVIKGLHDEWVAAGYEGAMIRLMDGRYEQGARSQSLLKVKEFMDAEFAFKNFEFGQRGVQDLIAVCWTSDGEKEFRAKVKGNKANNERLYELNDESEGKSFTVRYFGLTDDGIPRFPIGVGFRDYEG